MTLHDSRDSTRRRDAASARLFDASAVLVLLAFAVFTLASLAARLWWLFELTRHFVPQAAVAGCVLAAALALRRRRRLAFVALVLALVHVGLIAHALRPAVAPAVAPSADSQGPFAGQLAVAFLNLDVDHRSRDETLARLLEFDADVIALTELDRLAHDRLQPLFERWPHHEVLVRPDTYGLAILSRHPLHDVRRVAFRDRRIPVLIARVGAPGAQLTLVAVHVVPPLIPRWAEARDAQLAELGRLVAGLEPPVLVVGDLNCTPWSPAFDLLLQPAGLRDSRVGRGNQGSWPDWLPALLRLPIDHALVSPGLPVLARTVGPAAGSDHLPVRIDVLPAGAAHVAAHAQATLSAR